MFWLSNGQFFLLLGATVAIIGPKELPFIARTAGRIAGRAIGYVQIIRGQLESVTGNSQYRQVHKELQETMAQMEAIRHEVRSLSFMHMNPPMASSLNHNYVSIDKDDEKQVEPKPTTISSLERNVDCSSSSSPKTPIQKETGADNLDGSVLIIPISAESAGVLPPKNGEEKGSDIMLRAIIEAELANGAKDFIKRHSIDPDHTNSTAP